MAPANSKSMVSPMRIAPNSLAFSWLLGLLSALPTFGIDMILPTLPATAAALGAPASEVGLAMSVYLLGLGAALVVYGPLSDRIEIGRAHV